MKLSDHFKLEEFTYSKTAKDMGIDNTPGLEEINNLVVLCNSILEVIRWKYGKAIRISSGYRTEYLNKIIKGSPTSQHIKGEAADINQGSKEENRKLFWIICSLIESGDIVCGQLINEYNYSWIHISLPGKHKNQIIQIN